MAIKIQKKNFLETLELTFNARYISAKSTERKGGWGVWEGIREFLQNAKDSDDLGNKMWVYYSHGGAKGKGLGKLHLSNAGVSFGRESLILGGTTKDGDSRQRGQFGEGFKLASAVLVDHGCEVVIENGDEIWIPRLGKSERFGGAEILLVDVYRHPEPQGQYHVVIDGLSSKDYGVVKSRCLFLEKSKKKESISFGGQSILLGDKHVGQLYCRGLYVASLPEKSAFGYDLNVDLDRDRKMADPWSLKWAVREILKKAVRTSKIPVKRFLRLIESEDSIEAKVFSEMDGFGSTEFYKQVAAEFTKEHGDNAVAVAEMSQSVEAKHHGLKGVVVSPAVRTVVERGLGTFEARKTVAALDVATRLGADDLTDEELENLAWATEIAGVSENSEYRINVVEFVGDNVSGQWASDGEIRLARKIMLDRCRLIAVLVHELAHHGGLQDGSVEHRDACDRLFAKIIVSLSQKHS